MKMNKLMKTALILLPILSLMAAGTANSVTIYTTDAQTTAYCSYFTLVEDLSFSISLPLAALMCGITLTLSSFAVFAKKEKLLKPISVVSFIAMSLAVVPVLVKRDSSVVVVPNMVVPIAMGITSLLACMTGYKRQNTQPEGVRLS